MEWNNKKLNIIDCPGSDDFVGGAITSLNVTDQAVILINGQYGPEVGTQNNFRYTEKLSKPVIFLVNQLDSDKCDFDNLIATMKDIYGPKCVQIQYPIETGPGFNALIDVLLMKKYSWKPEGGAPIIEDIPEEEMDKAMELHAALVEAAAENDEGLMEKFFESESLTEDELREGIRKGLVTRSIFPVFCVCAGKSMGVHRLMEFLGNVVPFVSEMPKLHNTRGEEIAPDTNGPESVDVLLLVLLAINHFLLYLLGNTISLTFTHSFNNTTCDNKRIITEDFIQSRYILLNIIASEIFHELQDFPSHSHIQVSFST